MAITAAMVKELREETGAGMMECKKALTATDGDKEKAIEILKANGEDAYMIGTVMKSGEGVIIE